MKIVSLRAAIRRNPSTFLTRSWPYRAALFVALAAVLAPITAATLPTVVLFPLWSGVLAQINRRCIQLVDGTPIPSLPRDRERGGLAAVRERFASPMMWTEMGYAVLHAIFGFVSLGVFILFTSSVMTGLLVPFLLISTHLNGTPPALGTVTSMDLLWAIPAAVLGFVALLYTLSILALGLDSFARRLLSPRPELLQRQVQAFAQRNLQITTDHDDFLRSLERQIHDGAQIRLATGAMRLGMLELKLKSLNDPAISECLLLLEQIRVENETSLDSLREVMHGLRPRILEESGLRAAIADELRSVPIDVVLDGDPGKDLPDPVSYSLLQLSREAMTNVLKHSGATQLTISLSRHTDEMSISIKDNGIGNANALNGTGIIGMQERIQLLQGRFQMDSPPGGPTIVFASVPLSAGSGVN